MAQNTIASRVKPPSGCSAQFLRGEASSPLSRRFYASFNEQLFRKTGRICVVTSVGNLRGLDVLLMKKTASSLQIVRWSEWDNSSTRCSRGGARLRGVLTPP